MCSRTLTAMGFAVSLAFGACACAHRNAPVAPTATPAGVRFVFVDRDAETVALVGPFNQWSLSSHSLRREPGSSVWSIVVPLPSGEHEFMFVVDGTRRVVPPAAAEYVDDGFGSKNGVVIVPAKEP